MQRGTRKAWQAKNCKPSLASKELQGMGGGQCKGRGHARERDAREVVARVCPRLLPPPLCHVMPPWCDHVMPPWCATLHTQQGDEEGEHADSVRVRGVELGCRRSSSGRHAVCWKRRQPRWAASEFRDRPCSLTVRTKKFCTALRASQSSIRSFTVA